MGVQGGDVRERPSGRGGLGRVRQGEKFVGSLKELLSIHGGKELEPSLDELIDDGSEGLPLHG